MTGESEGADYFPDESPRPGTRMAKPMMGPGPSNRPYIKYQKWTLILLASELIGHRKK